MPTKKDIEYLFPKHVNELWMQMKFEMNRRVKMDASLCGAAI